MTYSKEVFARINLEVKKKWPKTEDLMVKATVNSIHYMNSANEVVTQMCAIQAVKHETKCRLL